MILAVAPIALTMMFGSTQALAHDAPVPLPVCATPAAPPVIHRVEVSFGSSLLYLEQPLLTKPLSPFTNKVVPLRSVLMLGEWLAMETVSVLMLVSIPIDANKTVQDDVVVEEFLGGTLALGGTWTPAIWRPWRRAAVKTQFGALLARRFASTAGDNFYPLAIIRVHVASPRGLSMYVGITFDVIANDLALLYGLGQRF